MILRILHYTEKFDMLDNYKLKHNACVNPNLLIWLISNQQSQIGIKRGIIIFLNWNQNIDLFLVL